jgi:hypothetical protein
MKHLLNDLSSFEKNRILEQYENSILVEINKFNQLVNSKLGNVKPLLLEQLDSKFDRLGIALTSRSDDEYFKRITDYNKMYTQTSNITLDEFMEGLRGAAQHPIGVVVEVFLSFFPVGKVAVIVVYGALLIYDINLLMKDPYNFDIWFNIFIDLIGIVATYYIGPAIALKSVVKGKNFKSFVDFIKWLRSTSIWSTIEGIIFDLTKGTLDILKYAIDGINWIIKKTGLNLVLTGLKFLLSSAAALIKWLLVKIGDIYAFIQKGIYQGIMKGGAPEKLAEPLSHGILGGGIAYGIEQLPKPGSGVYKTKEQEEMEKAFEDIKVIKPDDSKLKKSTTPSPSPYQFQWSNASTTPTTSILR